MLPLFTLVKSEEKASQKLLPTERTDFPKRIKIASPKGVILVPTRELCFQILKVMKVLGRYCKLKTEALIPGSSETKKNMSLEENYDVLVTVPSLFLKEIHEKRLFADELKFLVLDEADSLFDTEFRDLLKQFLREINLSQIKKVIAVTATVTRPVKRFLEEVFPSMTRVISKNVHKPCGEVKQKFVKVGPGFKARDKLCVKLIQLEPKIKAMIFCNTKKGAELLHGYMKQEIPEILCIHGDIQPESRTRILREFEAAESAVLICTDIASRGIDIASVRQFLFLLFKFIVLTFFRWVT